MFPWRAKHGTAFALDETQNGHAIDTEHERRQGGLDACHVAGSVYDASLQGGSVGDFEQRIDVVEVDLPEPEDPVQASSLSEPCPPRIPSWS